MRVGSSDSADAGRPDSAKLRRLRRLSGTAFDQQFLADTVADQQRKAEDLRTVRSQLRDDDPLARTVDQVLPLVEYRIEVAQALFRDVQ
jgi:predicted outer membrane protein